MGSEQEIVVAVNDNFTLHKWGSSVTDQLSETQSISDRSLLWDYDRKIGLMSRSRVP